MNKIIVKRNKKYVNYILLIMSIVFLIIFLVVFASNRKVVFIKNGQLKQARMGHSSILVPMTHKILIVGGVEKHERDSLKNLEIYDIEKNHSMDIIETTFSHILPDLFVNSDGNIAIMSNSGVEIYDITKNKIISSCKNPFNLDDYINETQRIQISDNIVLITGGKRELDKWSKKGKKEMAISNSAYLYDIKKNKIYKSFNLKIPRTNHQMVKNENDIYILGGITPKKEDSILIEKVNLSNYETSIVGNINQERYNFKAINVNKKILLIGGNSDTVEVYDMSNNKSILKSKILLKDSLCCKTFLDPDYSIYNLNINELMFIKKSLLPFCSGIYTYNLETETVKVFQNYKVARYSSINNLGDNNVIIIGGETQTHIPFMQTKICVIDKLCPIKYANNMVTLAKIKGE